jgi:hypothetical protein
MATGKSRKTKIWEVEKALDPYTHHWEREATAIVSRLERDVRRLLRKTIWCEDNMRMGDLLHRASLKQELLKEVRSVLGFGSPMQFN